MTNPTTITALPGMPFVDIEREFDAAPALLFRAYTDPELVSAWLVPHDMTMEIVEYDARPGGSYRYLHRRGDEVYAFHGVFHAVVADELLVQTFEYQGAPGQVSLDTARFEDLGGRTRVIGRSVFGSVEERDAMVDSGMESGVRDSMERLEELLRPAGRVIVDISMSLDGYICGPDADLENGMGTGGDVLHAWAIGDKTERDEEILESTLARTGAVIMGRTTFDVVDGPKGWNEEMGYAGERDQTGPMPPVFVLTHEVPEKVRLGDRFRFVTDGLESIISQARAAAGDKDVVIMGGGKACYEFLRAGLVDVLSIHLAPFVLGGGSRLFPESGPTLRLQLTGSESTPCAEHLSYKVIR